jgi:hypothetical protein
MKNICECFLNNKRYLGVSKLSEPTVSLFQLDLPLADILFDVTSIDMDSTLRLLVDQAQAGISVQKEDVRMVSPLHPDHDAKLVVSGFGLTHVSKIGNIKEREHKEKTPVSDLPAWFLKGFGDSVRLSNEPVRMSRHNIGFCEEAELVLIFYIDAKRYPQYVGFTFGNDITDIVRIKMNVTHLPYGKLCDCAVMSEWFAGLPPGRVDGKARITRDNVVVWNGSFRTGIEQLHFSLDKMLSHLWSYHTLRVPGTVHYVFLGADRNSSDFGFRLQIHDTVKLSFGRWGYLSNEITLNSALS